MRDLLIAFLTSIDEEFSIHRKLMHYILHHISHLILDMVHTIKLVSRVLCLVIYAFYRGIEAEKLGRPCRSNPWSTGVALTKRTKDLLFTVSIVFTCHAI